MENQNINTQQHPAEIFLRDEKNPTSLDIIYQGEKRRLFINRPDEICIYKKRSKRYGYLFNDWDGIERIMTSEDIEREKKEAESKLVKKYQRLAKKASFENDWLRIIASADTNKGLYDNKITTGTAIDGKTISLKQIRQKAGNCLVDSFLQAIHNRTSFQSSRFDYGKYEGSLWVQVYSAEDLAKYPQLKEGDVKAGFCKEYPGCLNGYYYLLINDDTFIGYDVD